MINLALIIICENDQQNVEDHLIFQEGGDPPHYVLRVRQ